MSLRPERTPNSMPGVRIEATHVSKSYVSRGLWPLVRRNHILVDASLTVRDGEIVALVGGNGSGKSTLMKVIVGVLDPDGGAVTTRGGVGYCPQSPILYEKLTVDETFQLFGVAYEMSPQLIAGRKEQLLQELGFGGWHRERIERLSGGTRQKLSLAIALLHDPEALLLDEPYTGFDYETYMRFWEISEELRRRGRGLLVISHFVEQQERFDRIYRIRDGRCERER